MVLKFNLKKNSTIYSHICSLTLTYLSHPAHSHFSYFLPPSLPLSFSSSQHMAELRCPFFSLLRHGGHASSKKKKSQILTDTNTVDFVIYPKTKKLIVWEVITPWKLKPTGHSSSTLPLSLAEARSGRSASSIYVDAVPCPFRSLSLSAWTGPTSSLPSLSVFFSFSFLFFLSDMRHAFGEWVMGVLLLC